MLLHIIKNISDQEKLKQRQFEPKHVPLKLQIPKYFRLILG